MSVVPGPEFGLDIPVFCKTCYRGNPQATAKDEAHRSLWRNPSDSRVVDKAFGQCHMDIVSRLKKVFMLPVRGS
ncbi:hypothetical protein G4V39_01565 [Thermosulfuriphilus ammonigenes]|uniref:Uncharacterized protein n=1 Tax=Thermosulfuriphilus ammonigenes TaxID=1936021 RepID=A0A6G7PTX7_9BACT|nr:hypothetical protein [Thermosulfuriphilus ammonigenes]MBA2848840.1 hypothetical protein [Thermosulfuriphilus ammonigenes]QIJ71037.1 hypothetical protein G4V39_01565 [Thermosulfuriphilus ammonigenes]